MGHHASYFLTFSSNACFLKNISSSIKEKINSKTRKGAKMNLCFKEKFMNIKDLTFVVNNLKWTMKTNKAKQTKTLKQIVKQVFLDPDWIYPC